MIVGGILCHHILYTVQDESLGKNDYLVLAFITTANN